MKKSTHELTKLNNTRLILRTVYTAGTISRADIARVTKLTPTTVSDLVEGLIQDRLVDEVGTGVSIGGKPPTLLSVNDESRLTIGIDLADHELHGAVVDLRGRIQVSKSVACDQTGEQAIALTKDLIRDLVAQVSPEQLLGIGLGSPGLVSTNEGIVRRAVKYHWDEIPLQQILEREFKVPVVVANDSQVAALAEYHYGIDPNEENLVLIKVGEGISAGLVIGCTIFAGDGHGAGEIGHICVVPNGIPCRCGHNGCLETVASLRGIAQAVRVVFPEAEGLSNDAVLEMLLHSAAQRNSRSLQIIHRVGEYLGVAAANIVGLLNIHKIVLAGPVSLLGEDLLAPMVDSMKVNVLDVLSNQSQISISQLGNNIVQIGAAALVQQSILGLF
ncbi:MAG: ROK family transcriptional regulator [Anaerolineaceae bacterium]|nr:ROK family transcriptional regulator [Anaerolineaceae bacterium]